MGRVNYVGDVGKRLAAGRDVQMFKFRRGSTLFLTEVNLVEDEKEGKRVLIAYKTVQRMQ